MTHPAVVHSAKRLARLAAVQGLYQIALTQRTPEEIIQEFREHPAALLQEVAEAMPMPDVDQDLFSAVLNGVIKHVETLDEVIRGSLDAKVSPDRLEVLLRAILRSGVFELHHHGSIPAGVIINDYVDVTHAFFGAKEPGFVNAVLDKAAKNLRAA